MKDNDVLKFNNIDKIRIYLRNNNSASNINLCYLSACNKGYISVIKFLNKTFYPLTKYDCFLDGFYNVCSMNKHVIVHFLYDQYTNYIQTQSNKYLLFQSFIKSNNFELVRRIPFDFMFEHFTNHQFQDCFELICLNGNYNYFNYLANIHPNFNFKQNSYSIYIQSFTNIQIAQYIYNLFPNELSPPPQELNWYICSNDTNKPTIWKINICKLYPSFFVLNNNTIRINYPIKQVNPDRLMDECPQCFEKMCDMITSCICTNRGCAPRRGRSALRRLQQQPRPGQS